jgi:nucleoid-associated protein YgaU
MVVVQRGDALWRIAYSSYGEGIRYVDIVRRNASAIDNPDLIFPNQIFTLPQKP